MDAVAKKQFFKFDPLTTIVLLLLVFFSSQFVAVFLVSLYPGFRGWDEIQSQAWLKDSTLAQFLFIALAEIIAIFLILKLVSVAKRTRQSIGIIRPRINDVGWALVAYALYFAAALVVMGLARSIPGIDFEQEQKVGFENAATNIELLMIFTSLVILVPLAEEVMFRGFLFSSLRSKYRFITSLIITSIIFGVAHLQFGEDAPLLWVAAIDTFILSAFLCYLREKTKSIWSAVFLHAIKNGLAFVILFGSKIAI